MSAVEADLIAYLDPLVTETAGTDLFEGPPPELDEDIVVLTHYTGEPAEDRVMGPSLTAPGIEISLVQLFVRNSAKTTAKSKADAYHALLDGLDGTFSGRKYFNVESINSMPFPLGQDARELWRYVANFRVEHAR